MNIEASEIENENLTNVQKFESDLRNARNEQENQVLEQASEDQTASIEFTQ
jgi:hypothetical protein